MNILIHWNDSYSVGIKEIDQQHKKLVDIINVVYDAVITEKPTEIIEQAFTDLNDYTIIHFSTERKYIDKLSNVDSEIHFKEHRSFTQKIQQYRDDFLLHNLKTSDEVINYLREWLIEHILVRDKVYARLVDKEI